MPRAALAIKPSPTARPRCDNCNGTGYLPEYSHIHSGKCFTCSGTGREINKQKQASHDRHFDNAHVMAFEDALQISHIFEWIDQDYPTRSQGSRR